MKCIVRQRLDVVANHQRLELHRAESVSGVTSQSRNVCGVVIQGSHIAAIREGSSFDASRKE